MFTFIATRCSVKGWDTYLLAILGDATLVSVILALLLAAARQ